MVRSLIEGAVLCGGDDTVPQQANAARMKGDVSSAASGINGLIPTNTGTAQHIPIGTLHREATGM